MFPSMPRPGLKVLLLLVVLVIAGPVLWTWATLSYDYSDGERAGYVQKLSRKGWIFYFSVRDDAVAKRIQEVVGKRVALTYEEHIGVPTNCFGETDYFVVDVRAVE
jgi:hypothetical protein